MLPIAIRTPTLLVIGFYLRSLIFLSSGSGLQPRRQGYVLSTLYRESSEWFGTINIGIGIGIAFALAIGLCTRVRPTAIAIPIPIATPRFEQLVVVVGTAYALAQVLSRTFW